jgi:hypothetical protein
VTDTNTQPEAKPAQPAPNPVSANPAEIKWPRDPYGITTELKAALLKAAAAAGPDDAKHAVLLATIRIGVQHAAARKGKDKQARANGLARIKAGNELRAARNRATHSVG